MASKQRKPTKRQIEKLGRIIGQLEYWQRVAPDPYSHAVNDPKHELMDVLHSMEDAREVQP